MPHARRISPRRWQAGCEPDLDPRAQAARHCRAQQLASAAQPASVTWLVRVTCAVGGRDSAGQTSQDGAYCTRPRVFLTKFGSLGPIGKTPRKPSWGCARAYLRVAAVFTTRRRSTPAQFHLILSSAGCLRPHLPWRRDETCRCRCAHLPCLGPPRPRPHRHLAHGQDGHLTIGVALN